MAVIASHVHILSCGCRLTRTAAVTDDDYLCPAHPIGHCESMSSEWWGNKLAWLWRLHHAVTAIIHGGGWPKCQLCDGTVRADQLATHFRQLHPDVVAAYEGVGR